jgi:hypothetical protein
VQKISRNPRQVKSLKQGNLAPLDSVPPLNNTHVERNSPPYVSQFTGQFHFI